MKKIIVIGASSAIAEHCARIWVEREPCELVLVGRNRKKIEFIRNDLLVRSPSSVIKILEADLTRLELMDSVLNTAFQDRPPEIALIAHGSYPPQVKCQNDLQLTYDTLITNGISTVLYAEGLAQRYEKIKTGKIVLIGSVAGDRGRKTNYTYGAAKGLISRFAQGLQHRFAGTNIQIILVKPGPTLTPMTAHLENSQSASPVDVVAKAIVNGVDRNMPVIYTPAKWTFIMMVVRHLPKFIMHRLNI